jgi:excinuclease UvrABC nuclease subunit
MVEARVAKDTFDDKFGAQLWSEAPTCPGVYRFLDAKGVVLYVGKAKNLRRRLANYRNASRKRVHRKLRVLVSKASALTYELCESDHAAQLRESELIRQLRPRYNVEGAFDFLYPSIGVGECARTTLVCFTTRPEEFEPLGLRWYGCFRSRPRVKLAFEGLVELLSLIAHREKSAHLPEYPRLKGSRMVGFRRVPKDVAQSLDVFFAGKDRTLASQLARLLLDKPRALQSAADVQEWLQQLAHFFTEDAERLRRALDVVGDSSHHIARDERDALFIRAKAARETTASATKHPAPPLHPSVSNPNNSG